ncbi:hypothetical protein HOY82DRAFT_593297 [Tuber indicum]|nr:hypothetical protein HOY82DRAFT_593297 [Tuber indicum]
MSAGPSLPLPEFEANPDMEMKILSQIKMLGRKQIVNLRENSESDLCCQNVSEQELDDWKLENPDLLEAKDIRFEYNFLTKHFIIKCMPTSTHNSFQRFFVRNISRALDAKIGASQADHLLEIDSGTTFGGFKGDWTGSSEKVPDAYVKPSGSEFPSVVCEAGWSETLEDLIADARLWLLYTGGLTKIVIILSIIEKDTRNTQATDLPEKILGDASKMGDARTEEQALIQAIAAGIDLNDLAARLIDLNTRTKLTRPLVGNLEVTIHVYQACDDQADIKETFSATVIPSPPTISKEPTEFKIAFMDIFGGNTPAGVPVDPTDDITFSLADLRRFVTSSLGDTERLRATRRAKKLLKEAGEWEEADTFTQHKRRRQSGGSSSMAAGKVGEAGTFTQHKRRRRGD